jgi:BolA-like protein 1
VGAGGDSSTSQQSAQEVAEPRAEGMENEGSKLAAFGAQEDEKSVTDMPSQEGQWEEREDKGESGAQAQMHGRPGARAGAREASRRRVSSTRARRCWSEARSMAAREQKRTGVAALEQA